MPKYPGRIISATPPSVSASGASGVWTTEEVAQYEQAGTWPEAVPVLEEPNFNQTVLLLHGDGTNGAQNNTFLDGSTNNFTITRNGNTTQGTFSPFSVGAGEWSVASDGSGDNLSIAYNSELDLTQGDYTVEFWIYRTVGGVQLEVINQRGSTIGWLVRINSNNTIVFGYAGGGATVTSVGTIPINEWVHVAGTREGNTPRVFINGVLDNTGSGGNGTTSTATFYINRSYISSGGGVTGYLSNLRIVKGTALYTADFTVPTAPLTAVSGTSLLTLQDNRFVDNSTNNFAITNVGNIATSSFSPFAPTAAYSAGTNGGSGYFDGTGDNLYFGTTSSFNFFHNGSSFTIEAWIYRNVVGNYQAIASTVTGSVQIGNEFAVLNTNTLRLSFVKGVAGQSAFFDSTVGIVPLNEWCHVAATFDASGKTATFYVNGVQEGSSSLPSYAYSASNASNAMYIGSRPNSAQLFTGYISNVRLSDNIRSITLPTAPYTSDGNTSFLLNFTNAGIFDNTGKNNLETVGNAQIDTTTKKFGTGSMKFDGTGDFLIAPDTLLSNFGSGDFTIEFWLYLNTTANAQMFIDSRPPSTQGVYITIYTASSRIYFYTASSNRITSDIITTNTWYHVALCRSGTSTKLFIDGTQSGSTYTDSNNYLSSRTIFGGGYANTSNISNPLNGFIDDLRITKGVARYTANFTPPTAAFLDQ